MLNWGFGEEDGPGLYQGMIVNRSLSDGIGNGVSVNSGKKAKSNPQFSTGFEGLNLFQQRYARGGNQFTVEPPDQALCVGNGYVLEVTPTPDISPQAGFMRAARVAGLTYTDVVARITYSALERGAKVPVTDYVFS